jgi:cyclophilin family peptidyl-prolyl cis-trans isomerase
MKNFIYITIGAFLLVIFLAVFFGDKAEEKIGDEDVLVNNETNNMEYLITLKTTEGNIRFETYVNDAPNTVNNFVKLAKDGFYDEVIFHRVIDGFMIQGGDPTGTGMGGPGYTFDDEINPQSEIYKEGYKKGVVAMANAGPNTQGSQFFIMVADYPLPPLYTIFGKVVEGQEIADEISKVETNEADKPLQEIKIKEVVIEEKQI